MIRTNPAHVGKSPLTSLTGDNPPAAETGVEKTSGTFEQYLLDAVTRMNSQQTDVDKMQEKLITDPDSVDIHDVTTAMAKAQMSLSLAQTVIDRLVTGWSEITTNR
jgi:flagellar hook-basal body complex protein FliE